MRVRVRVCVCVCVVTLGCVGCVGWVSGGSSTCTKKRKKKCCGKNKIKKGRFQKATCMKEKKS